MQQTGTETGFDFDDNAEFTNRAALFKKIGMTLMILFVLAGLSGLLGYGEWTKFQTGDGSGFYLEYEKFLRAKKETPLKIVIPPSGSGEIVIFMEQKYFDKVSVTYITPQPLKTTCDEAGYTFYFPSSGTSPKHIELKTTAKKMGCVRTAVRTGLKELIINQIIYP